jgi:hypothetical protein
MYTPNAFHTNYSAAINAKEPAVGGNIHHNEENSSFMKKYSSEIKYVYLPYGVYNDMPRRVIVLSSLASNLRVPRF